jgi:type II secretory pathway component GspD/PulD (secretin)
MTETPGSCGRLRGLVAAALLAAALYCCPASHAQEQSDRLEAGDLVYINVFRHPELSATTSIDANGMVNLPHVGNINIAGKSEADATEAVRSAMSVVLKNPRVTVSRSAGVAITEAPMGDRKVNMRTEVVQVKNARAENLYNALSGMATEGGSLSFDEATNTIIITDEPATLQNMVSVVTQLDNIDNQMAQVHIEARVAEIESTAIKEAGLRWFAQGDKFGGGYTPNARQDARVNSLRTFNDPTYNERIGVDDGNGFNSGSSRNYLDQPTFDRRMQIPIQVAAPGQMFLGYLNSGIDLGVMLDALVADNKAELLATPYIRAVNHETAEIKMTEEFPYTELSTAGLNTVSNTRFLDIGIVLEVTPHIRQDPEGMPYVQLELEPEVSSATGVANGVPIRSVRRSSSTANVRDGQTLVIGGIVQSDQRDVIQKVPGLGDVPVLGNLFKHKEKSAAQRELMIFVTPKIYERPESATWNRSVALTGDRATGLVESLEARADDKLEP